jgi:hypothetical protein
MDQNSTDIILTDLETELEISSRHFDDGFTEAPAFLEVDLVGWNNHHPGLDHTNTSYQLEETDHD